MNKWMLFIYFKAQAFRSIAELKYARTTLKWERSHMFDSGRTVEGRDNQFHFHSALKINNLYVLFISPKGEQQFNCLFVSWHGIFIAF